MLTPRRKPLPVVLVVTLGGVAASGCGTTTPPPVNECPTGCGHLVGADGGKQYLPDGGPYCLC